MSRPVLFLLAGLLIGTAVHAAEPATIEEVVAAATANMDYVDNAYLKDRQAQNAELLLLDVRTQREYDAGHIPGSVWMERGIVEFRMARMVRDPDTEILVYCAVGNRSALVVKALREIGYRNVKAHTGFTAWVTEGNAYDNYLGRSKMIELREINAATNARAMAGSSE
jgi:rhodanese-related sulfurtransferase